MLGRIQDLVRVGSDKRPPTLSNGYCNLISPFFTRKSMVKIIFPFHFRGFDRTTRTTPGSGPDMYGAEIRKIFLRTFNLTPKLYVLMKKKLYIVNIVYVQLCFISFFVAFIPARVVAS